MKAHNLMYLSMLVVILAVFIPGTLGWAIWGIGVGGFLSSILMEWDGDTY